MLRQVLADPDALAALVSETQSPQIAATLSRTAAFLAEGLGIATLTEADRRLDPEAKARLTQQGIVAAFQAIAEKRPLLLHLEDIHWLDNDSRSVIASLLRRIDGSGPAPAIGILMTARPRERHLPQYTGIKLHRLERLEAGAVTTLAATLLGDPLSARLSALIEDRSAGVPLFVAQPVRFLQETDFLSRVNGVWHLANRFEAHRLPADARALLVSRIDRLSGDAYAAVAFAAVFGRGVTAPDIAAMAQADDRPLPDSGPALSEAAAAGVLVAEGGAYVLLHALFRDAVYETQLTTRREHLHLLAADLLKGQGAGPEVLALHYDRGGLAGRAIPLHLQAGEAASAAFLNEAAIWHHGRALDLTPKADIRARFDIAFALNRLLFRISDHTRQEPVLDELERLAETLDPEDRLTAAVCRADFLAERSLHEEAVAHLEPLLPLAEAFAGTDLAVRFFTALAHAYNYSDLPDRREIGVGHARTAVTHAHTSGTAEQIAMAIAHEASFYRYTDDPRTERRFQEALNHTSDPVLIARVSHRMGSIAFRRGDPEEGRRRYDTAQSLADETGDLHRKGALALGMAFEAEREGDFALAEANYRRVLDVARELNQSYLYMQGKRSLAGLAWNRGRLAEAEVAYREIQGEGGA